MLLSKLSNKGVPAENRVNRSDFCHVCIYVTTQFNFRLLLWSVERCEYS